MPKNVKTAMTEFMEKCAKTFGTAENDFTYIYGNHRIVVGAICLKPTIEFKVNDKHCDKFIYLDGSRYVTAKKQLDIVYDTLCDYMYKGGDFAGAFRAIKKQLNQ